jgi:hypothetical protein
MLMIKKMHDVIAHIKAFASECITSHWVMHCQGPTVEESANILKMVLDKIVKILKLTNSRPFN